MIDWLRNRRARRNCWHHDRQDTGATWIEEQLIDLGRRKMFWCVECGQTWIV